MDIHLGPTISFKIYKDDDLQHEIDPCQVRIKGEGVIYKKITCYLAFTGAHTLTSVYYRHILLTSSLGQLFKLPKTIVANQPYKIKDLELAEEITLDICEVYVDQYY